MSEELVIPEEDIFHGISLTEKQRKFIPLYFENNRDPTKAAEDAGYTMGTEISRRQTVYNIMNSPNIKAGMTRYLESALNVSNTMRIKSNEIDLLEIQANYDPMIFYKKDGTIKDLMDIPDKYREACIMNKEVSRHPKDPSIITERYILVNKQQAAKELHRLLGIDKDVQEIQLTGKGGAELPAINITVGKK